LVDGKLAGIAIFEKKRITIMKYHLTKQALVCITTAFVYFNEKYRENDAGMA